MFLVVTGFTLFLNKLYNVIHFGESFITQATVGTRLCAINVFLYESV